MAVPALSVAVASSTITLCTPVTAATSYLIFENNQTRREKKKQQQCNLQLQQEWVHQQLVIKYTVSIQIFARGGASVSSRGLDPYTEHDKFNRTEYSQEPTTYRFVFES